MPRISRCLTILWLCFLSSAISLADQNADELPDLFNQLAQATVSEEANRLEGRIWQKWLQAPDKNSEYLLAQISRALSVGGFELALRLCNQLVDSAPDFAEAWNKRATVHYQLGNHAASVADIRKTLALEPRHFGAISGLGLIFLREQNLQAALDAFEQVLIISPASQNALRSVEQVRNKIGREI